MALWWKQVEQEDPRRFKMMQKSGQVHPLQYDASWPGLRPGAAMDGDAASGAATASEHGAAVFPQTMAYTLEMLEEEGGALAYLDSIGFGAQEPPEGSVPEGGVADLCRGHDPDGGRGPAGSVVHLARAEEGGKEPYPRPGRPFKRRWLPVYGLVMLVALGCLHFGHGSRSCEIAYMLCSSLLAFVLGNSAPPNVKSIFHPIFASVFGSWLALYLWALSDATRSFHDVLVTYSSPGATDRSGCERNPLVVALALLLFERRKLLKRDRKLILGTSLVAACSGVVSTAVMARLLQLPGALGRPSIGRYCTAPLALAVAGNLDASPPLTVAMVVASGFVGIFAAKPLLARLRVKQSRERGLAIGAVSHVLGTVSLASWDEAAVPYSALCFVLASGSTAALTALPPDRSKPLFEDFLKKRGIEFWPTVANFIFCYFSEPVRLESALRERGILVRPKKDHKGVLGLRVSFGTEAQMKEVIKALEELLAAVRPVSSTATFNRAATSFGPCHFDLSATVLAAAAALRTFTRTARARRCCASGAELPAVRRRETGAALLAAEVAAAAGEATAATPSAASDTEGGGAAWRRFPTDFVWGVATAAFQIEGADTFSHVKGNIYEDANADVACDHYHRYEEDLQLVKQLGAKAYRFSISWSRVLPTGVVADGVNEQGLAFYEQICRGCLARGVEPVATLYHWDLPEALEAPEQQPARAGRPAAGQLSAAELGFGPTYAEREGPRGMR
eukprot:g2850.t1